jgi:hypothetical protein
LLPHLVLLTKGTGHITTYLQRLFEQLDGFVRFIEGKEEPSKNFVVLEHDKVRLAVKVYAVLPALPNQRFGLSKLSLGDADLCKYG